MTVLTDTQVVTASGGLVELGYSQITSDVTVNTSNPAAPVDIASTTVVCDGSPVLVEFFCSDASPSSSANTWVAIDLWYDGSEKVRYWGLVFNPASNPGGNSLQLQYRITPPAGSHTFKATAHVNNSANVGTVSAGSATTGRAPAFLRVSKIVTATQWPAVTTGTIICTSSTRPASPFAGQVIYETDTSLSYTYNGSAWVQTGNVGAWTSYTPTWTGLSVGNGTQNCAYTQIGKTVHARVRLTFGSTTSVTGNPAFTLPVNAASYFASPQYQTIGTAALMDGGTGYNGFLVTNSASSVMLATIDATAGTSRNLILVTSAAPFAWNSGDTMAAHFFYEAA